MTRRHSRPEIGCLAACILITLGSAAIITWTIIILITWLTSHP